MKPLTRAYMAFIGLFGLFLGVDSLLRFLNRWQGAWTLSFIGIFITLVLLCILCRCLPLYIREDCTIDMSFISILAIVLILGPEAAVAIVFLTTPFVVVPTADGKGHSHIFNTDPWKTCFNIGNHNISFYLAGMAYYAAGGVPGNITLPGVLLPALIFICCATLLDSTVLLLFFVLEQRIKFYPTIFQMFFSLIPSIACSAPMAYFLAMLLQMPSGAWMALLFMLPLLLARYSFKLFLKSQQQQYDIIHTLNAAIEAKDPYTQGHSARVGVYATRIAEHLKLPKKQIQRLGVAALFHDIGKIGIPDSILLKSGALTPEERQHIQHHPEIGVKIIGNIDAYQDLVDLVLHHHEFYNGGGYPSGTSGDDLTLSTYILSAADAYDAITTDRPYRKGMTPQKAAAIMEAEMGRQFHPLVAQAVIEMVADGSISAPMPEDLVTPNKMEESNC
jgi:putative nucleotidyltransferase with HDIG domain